MERRAFWQALGRILGALALLQLAKTGLTLLIFRFLPRTNFTDRAVSTVLMLGFTALIVLFARRRGLSLSVFPERFGVGYLVAAAAVTLLLASSALLFSDHPIDRFFSFTAALSPRSTRSCCFADWSGSVWPPC